MNEISQFSFVPEGRQRLLNCAVKSLDRLVITRIFNVMKMRNYMRRSFSWPSQVQRRRGTRVAMTVLLLLATLLINSSADAGTDDYPPVWRDAAMDSTFDTWGMYNRECTSFVAWRLHARNGFEMPFHDDASGWSADAQARGYAVTTTPAVGSVAWWASGASEPHGHVAWVESINSNGTITIEEYNHGLTGTYSERTIAAGSANGYVHFKDLAALPAQESMQPASLATTGGFVVFGRGNDNQLYNAWQPSAGSNWTPFQLVTNGGNLAAPPAIYREQDGSFSAYAVNTAGTLLTTWQTSPGSAWQPWTVIGGGGVTGVPVVERASTGGLVIFVRGSDGQLYNTWQTSAGSNWVPLQIVTPGGSLTGTPAIHREQDGRFSAYATDANGVLLSSWQSAPGSAWQPWTVIAGGTPLSGKPAVDVASTGGLVLFARGRDGQLYNTWQTSAGSNWVPLQVVTSGGSLGGSPATHREQDGRFSAYAINANGALLTTWQTAPGSGWQPWTVIGGSGLTPSNIPDIQVGSTGGLVAFARGADGQLYNTWQTGPGSNWVPLQVATSGLLAP